MSTTYQTIETPTGHSDHPDAGAIGMCPMKLTMLAVGVVTNLGALLALQVHPELTRYSDFIVAGVCGSAGYGIHLACFGWASASPRQIVAKAFASSAVAAAFGNMTCYMLAKTLGVERSVDVLIPVATVWGIGGLEAIRIHGPKLLEKLGAASLQKVDDLAGVAPLQVQPNDDSTKRMIKSLNEKVDKLIESGEVPKPGDAE